MSDKSPTISVVIPAYNSSKFIKRTIASVINQTYKDWELIVVDDGSKDDTGEIVKSFCAKDGRIKYVLQENSGSPSGPTNHGIRESKGKYIAILQHDDEWLPEKLQKQLDLISLASKEGVGFVGCSAISVNDIKGTESESDLHIPDNREDLLVAILSKNIIPYPSAVLVRKDIFDNMGYFDTKFSMADDWEMWIRLVVGKVGFAFIKRPLFRYHIYGGNITKTIAAEKKIRDLEHLLEKHGAIYDRYPKAKSRVLVYLGKLYADSGNMARSRQILMTSISLDRKNLKPYMVLSLTIFGKKIYSVVSRVIISLKRAYS